MTSSKPEKCDGNHGGPRCADPECWNDSPQDPLKDNQIAALINKVCRVAREFHNHDSLRLRIAQELVPVLKACPAITQPAACGEGSGPNLWWICEAANLSSGAVWKRQPDADDIAWVTNQTKRPHIAVRLVPELQAGPVSIAPEAMTDDQIDLLVTQHAPPVHPDFLKDDDHNELVRAVIAARDAMWSERLRAQPAGQASSREAIIDLSVSSGLSDVLRLDSEASRELSVRRLVSFYQLAIEHFCAVSGKYLTNDASRDACIAEAVAAEREACALICDTTPPQPFRPSIEAAHAIRQRGNQKPTGQSGFAQALSIRAAQGWKLTGKAVPLLYTDEINGQQIMRDDVWLCTTEALRKDEPVQVPEVVMQALDAALAACDRVIGQDKGVLGGIDFHALKMSVTRALAASQAQANGEHV